MCTEVITLAGFLAEKNKSLELAIEKYRIKERELEEQCREYYGKVTWLGVKLFNKKI